MIKLFYAHDIRKKTLVWPLVKEHKEKRSHIDGYQLTKMFMLIALGTIGFGTTLSVHATAGVDLTPLVLTTKKKGNVKPNVQPSEQLVKEG